MLWLFSGRVEELESYRLKTRRQCPPLIDDRYTTVGGTRADDLPINRNKLVDEWYKISKELVHNNSVLEGDLSKLKITTNKQIQQILMTMPTPKTCESSIAFLREEIPAFCMGGGVCILSKRSGALGETRTLTSIGHCDLNTARLPIPPPEHFYS